MRDRRGSLALAGVFSLFLFLGPVGGHPGSLAAEGPEGEVPPQGELWDALRALFPEGELFLVWSPGTPPRPPRPSLYSAWKNPRGWQPEKPAPMEFLGVALLGPGEGPIERAALAFAPRGGVRGVLFKPPLRVGREMEGLLEGVKGRGAQEGRARLSAYLEAGAGRAEEKALARALEGLLGGYLSLFPEGRFPPPASPPRARKVQRPPRPEDAFKVLAVVVLIALIGFFNIYLARKVWGRREEE